MKINLLQGRVWVHVITMALLMTGCSDQAPQVSLGDPSFTRPQIVTTSYALFEIASRLLPDRFEINFPNANNGTPRSWQPTVTEITRLQAADLILLSGANYEPWILSVSLPFSRTVDTSSNYSDQLLSAAGSVVHQHGPQGATEASATIWSTWLSVRLLQAQADAVATVLRERFPQAAAEISKNQESLAEEMANLQNFLRRLQSADWSAIVVNDEPYFGYLIQDLGWDVDSTPPDTATAAATARLRIRLVADESAVGNGDSEIIDVEIDFCEAHKGDAGLCERLRGNLRRLLAAGSDRQNE